MSARNKKANKVNRRVDRENAAIRFQRRPASSIDRDASSAVLCDHKQRLGAKGRNYLKRSRENVVVMPTPEVVRPFAVKLAEKLAKLTLRQVIRRRSQFAARAAGAKYKLADLAAGSMFRPVLQRLQDSNIFACKQAQAELDARMLHATNKLKA